MTAMPLVFVAACLLLNGSGQILLSQRPKNKPMAGLWEFPGGKIEAHETPEQAIIREIDEELGLVLQPDHLLPLTFASHAYDKFHLLMPVYLCQNFTGEPMAKEGQILRWVSPRNLSDYTMPAADIPLIPILIHLLDFYQ